MTGSSNVQLRAKFDNVNFPKFEELPDYAALWGRYYRKSDSVLSPKRHWCFLAEIEDFYPDNGDEPDTFACSDLKPGYTIAILYAHYKHMLDMSVRIGQEELEHVKIFKASLAQTINHLKKLDEKINLGHETCFECEVDKD